MNRRAFLRQVSIAAASGLLLPEIARELMAPAKTILLPPQNGWIGWRWRTPEPLTLTEFLGPMPRGSLREYMIQRDMLVVRMDAARALTWADGFIEEMPAPKFVIGRSEIGRG